MIPFLRGPWLRLLPPLASFNIYPTPPLNRLSFPRLVLTALAEHGNLLGHISPRLKFSFLMQPKTLLLLRSCGYIAFPRQFFRKTLVKSEYHPSEFPTTTVEIYSLKLQTTFLSTYFYNLRTNSLKNFSTYYTYRFLFELKTPTVHKFRNTHNKKNLLIQ